MDNKDDMDMSNMSAEGKIGVVKRKKKKKEIDLDNIKPEEQLKYEIAKELGYLDKVMSTGWESLTAKESGRIGGILAKKRRDAAKNQNSNQVSSNPDRYNLENNNPKNDRDNNYKA